MNKPFRSWSALVALGLAGCSSPEAASDPNVLVNNDFETLAGWLPEAQDATLTREKAHSGSYALKVDGTHEYSLGYHAQLGRLRDTRIRKIKVTAWAFVPTGSSASLVITVGNPVAPSGQPLLWQALELGKSKEFGKWVEVSKVLTLPETATAASTLGLYLWRTGSNQPVYLDDLRVAIEP